MAITAASATPGTAMIAFSRSTEDIHSPPLLMRSFDRSMMAKSNWGGHGDYMRNVLSSIIRYQTEQAASKRCAIGTATFATSADDDSRLSVLKKPSW